MNKLFPILILLSACSANNNQSNQLQKNDSIQIKSASAPIVISDSTNVLENKVQQLELKYIVWGCACANWVTSKDFVKYNDTGLESHCIFIEPADSTLYIPEFFKPGDHNLIVTGQFYQKKDYPKGTIKTEEQLEKAKVFRYSNFQIVGKENKVNSNSKIQALTASYCAIACTCAQWCESRLADKPEQRSQFYLERADSSLVDADSLYGGVHFPLQVMVTGRFIADKAFPKNYNPTKGDPEPARVFRYNKIKVLSKL